VTGITGLPENGRLLQVIDADLDPIELPPSGLVISRKLADLLGARRGDRITVEVLVERRPVSEVTVVDLVDDYIGINAYMRLEAANRLMHEGDAMSGAYLQLDEAHVDELFQRVKVTPAVAGLSLKGAALKSWEDTLLEMFNMVRSVTVLFAAIIAFGVVYNSARISLSERSRELATLRVMGFRRGEIAYILLGELALLILVAIPLSMAVGYGLAALVVRLYDLDVYRLPLVVAPKTYALAAVTVLVSAVLSALAVRRRLESLDLIAVLKTRE
jgi:putative ABC transport system permease protein